MSLSILLTASTVIMFLLFIGIVTWAWSRKRQQDFDAAAQLPFAEDFPVHDTRSKT